MYCTTFIPRRSLSYKQILHRSHSLKIIHALCGAYLFLLQHMWLLLYKSLSAFSQFCTLSQKSQAVVQLVDQPADLGVDWGVQ